jgi:acyl-CoA thioesterase-1
VESSTSSLIAWFAAALFLTCAAPSAGFAADKDTPPAAGQEIRILALGDSITAGYGLPRDQSLPVRLEMALKAEGIKARVINAGVSGDTSAGGLARLDWSLAERPQIALVGLGANDMLRGLDPAATRANLKAIIQRLKKDNVKVLLMGMRALPNLGPEYVAAFEKVYPDLAAEENVALYPFLLEGVATQIDLNQGDRIHPNGAGVDVIVKGLLPYVKELVQ